MRAILRNLSEIKRYPSAIVGIIIILALVSLAAYAMISLPYKEAIRLWRGGEEVWRESPRLARPIWWNLITKENLPPTIILSSQDQGVEKHVDDLGDIRDVSINFTFDYQYDAFPQELSAYFTSQYISKQPHVSMTWLTPDGREIRLGQIPLRRSETYRFAQDDRLMRRLRNVLPQIALFADPDSETPVPLKGTYTLQVEGLLFEEASDFEAKVILYGQVHGLAGTDHSRRNLMVALLWGTPIALSFGLLAALGSTITTMIIAAIGVWFGGIVDASIQRITEVVLILPLLPILIMVGTMYDRSIWTILGVVIALGIFGPAVKTYRAVFLQVRESPYIEAARAYGAGNVRIIFNYLIPRIVPLLVPQLVVLVPTYVFLEASLAVLGIGDPILPTWGKVIDDARANGALFQGLYYWVLQPSILLMLTGLGFAMVGFALDRIFNPRLRGL
jgi:peptide/nickel transport system permease protein